MLLLKTVLFAAFFSSSLSFARIQKDRSETFGKLESAFNKSAKLCPNSSKTGCVDDPTLKQFGTEISRYKGNCISSKGETFIVFLELYPANTVVLEGSLKNLNIEINYAYLEEDLNKKSSLLKNSGKMPSWVEPLLPDFVNSGTSAIMTGDAYFMFEMIRELVYGTAVVRGNPSALALKMTAQNTEVSDFNAYCSLDKY